MAKTASKAEARKKGPSQIVVAAQRAVVFLTSTYLTWILLFPKASGLLGFRLGAGLIEVLGATAYALPVVLYFGLYQAMSRNRRASIFTAIALVGLTAFSILCAQVGAWTATPWFGGIVGQGSFTFLSTWLGAAGSFLFAVALLLFSVQAFLDIPWAKWAESFLAMLRADYAEWQRQKAAPQP